MYSKISNPLTIIAIFAALSEGFASYALINLPHDLQQIFIYFVIAFPSSILFIFFLVLVFKHSVLYAPSDFKDEGMFLELMNLNNLKSQVISNLTIPSPDEPPLTPQQLENVSHKIDKAFSNAIEDNLFGKHGTADYPMSFIQKAKIIAEASAREKNLLDFIESNKNLSTGTLFKEMSIKFGITERTVKLHINNLIVSGWIKQIGNKYCVVNHPDD